MPPVGCFEVRKPPHDAHVSLRQSRRITTQGVVDWPLARCNVRADRRTVGPRRRADDSQRGGGELHVWNSNAHAHCPRAGSSLP